MSRSALLSILAVIALPISALADPPFHPPSNLPVPQGGRPPPPTPHPYFRPTYYLSCTVGYGQLGAITNMHIWTVTNYGHNTVPAVLAFHTLMGSMTGDFTMPHALAAGDAAQFGTPVVAGIIPYRKGDACEVWFDR